MSRKAIVLGAGFSGSTLAHLLKREGWDCVVIEKCGHPGGGCWTHSYGGHPYTNGPRVYYGYSDKIFNWISRFVEMRKLDFELLSYVESERGFFSYPIHADDIPRMSKASQISAELSSRDMETTHTNFEDYWVGNIGQTLYDMFVNKYSKKMWGLESNTELDTFSWSAKDNPINTGSKIAYKGSYLAYPYGFPGYNPYFEKNLAGIDVLYNQNVSRFDLPSKTVFLDDGTSITSDIIISSIPIEELCEYRLGDLPYAGRQFIPFVLPCKEVCAGNTRFLHYTQNEPYTRIVEYKKLTYHEAEDTLLVMELPCNDGGKLYPYMIKQHLEKANQYQKTLPDGIYSTGRLGTYRYSTIEQTIAQAFDVFNRITGKSIDGLEKEFYSIGDINIVKERKVTSTENILKSQI